MTPDYTQYVGPQTPEEWAVEDALLLLPDLMALDIPDDLRSRSESVLRRLRDAQERAEALRNA